MIHNTQYLFRKNYSPTKSFVVLVRVRVRFLESSGRNKRFSGRTIGTQYLYSSNDFNEHLNFFLSPHLSISFSLPFLSLFSLTSSLSLPPYPPPPPPLHLSTTTYPISSIFPSFHLISFLPLHIHKYPLPYTTFSPPPPTQYPLPHPYSHISYSTYCTVPVRARTPRAFRTHTGTVQFFLCNNFFSSLVGRGVKPTIVQCNIESL